MTTFECAGCGTDVEVTGVVCGHCHGDMDIEPCPKCDGRKMLDNASDPMGDDPERLCDLCSGNRQVPGGYARAYKELIKENEGLDGLIWTLQQEKVALELRVAELRGQRDHWQSRGEKLLRKYAPPADSPRGRPPLPTG